MILFINQEFAKCGVYQFGKNIGNIIQTVNEEKFGIIGNCIPCMHMKNVVLYKECKDGSDFFKILENYKPEAIIFNHHPIPMSWLIITHAKIKPSALIVHDFPENWSGVANIYVDPTYIENGINYKLNRPILRHQSNKNVIPNSVGSFGFGFSHKCFEKLIQLVNNEFDEAVIRLHIPFNTHVDKHGMHAIHTARRCREVPKKENIKLEINHDYMTDNQLLDWLSENEVNCFIYEGNFSTGVSSATDWAIAAKRPIAITNHKLFRHLVNIQPSLLIENGIKNVIKNGFDAVAKATETWTYENMYNDLVRIGNACIRS